MALDLSEPTCIGLVIPGDKFVCVLNSDAKPLRAVFLTRKNILGRQMLISDIGASAPSQYTWLTTFPTK